MKVAVLLSSYNGRRFLPAQLESLAKQTIADCVTVYIRNDGSADSCADLIAQWKDKINIVPLAGENLGPAQSFWALLCDESIQADYYAFCDQDDVWDPDKLEVAVVHLGKGAHFYACNCRLINGAGEMIQQHYQETEPEITIPRLFVAGVVQGCAMVFTHQLREMVVSKQVQCVPMHDIIVMLYAFGCGGLVWDQKPRFSYRVHESNMVARENKNIIDRLRTTWWNWQNSSKNSMATVAAELLQKADNLGAEDVRYLQLMAKYKSSPASKYKLLTWKFDDKIPTAVMRSYRIRLLLNMF